MSELRLQWRRPDPPLTLAWRGPDDSIRAALDNDPMAQIPTVIGPPGSGGSGGASSFQFTQASALALWTVNHNLGFYPSTVTVLTPGGTEVNAAVNNISVNQLTIEFSAPFAGVARIS